MTVQNLNIRQDMQRQMFFVKVNGGHAWLKYDKPKEDVLDYKETYVPTSSRNKGVGSRLVAHALDYANDQKLNVEPSCPFVNTFIEKHPEYENVLEPGS